MANQPLPEHVRALQRPDAYPQPPRDIELVQTHISYVFLADDDVYKLKKPVDVGFADFTTLARRKAACEAEVRLNRRGCPGDTYRGVVRVTQDDGRFRIAGEGKVVDYAVHMARLPRDRMMDHLLEQDAVDFDMVARLAARVAELHRGAERSARITRIGGSKAMAQNWRDNLDDLRARVGRTLGQRRYDRIDAFATAFLRDEATLLKRRDADGWVRDCHGDMRSDSVVFCDDLPGGICIYDCIEFNDAFRYGDTGLDVAFLAMDLDYRGRPDLSDLFIGLYLQAIGDPELPLLLPLYKAYRATVRAKVESLLAADAGVAAAKRADAERRARAYFRLAETYARRKPASGLTLVGGASGSGKSLLAGVLASRQGAVLLSTDVIRRDLFQAQGRGGAVDSGNYTPEARARVYEEMQRRARAHLASGRPVILDATFTRRDERAPLISLARELRQRLLVVECSAPDEVVRERQKRREGEAWSASEGRYEVYLAQKAQSEPADEVPSSQRVAVDTTLPVEDQVRVVVAACAGRGAVVSLS